MPGPSIRSRVARALWPALAAWVVGAQAASVCDDPTSTPPPQPPGWQATQRLSSASSGPVTTVEPALATNAGGAIVVAWHATQPRPGTQPPVYENRPYVARLPSCPLAVKALEPTVSVWQLPDAPVVLAIDAQGRAMAVWRHDLDGVSAGLMASETAPGVDWSAGTMVAGGLGDRPVVYRLGMAADGHAFLAWTDRDKGLRVQRRLPAGGWTFPTLMEGPKVYTDTFELAVSSGGSAFVHWTTELGPNRSYVRRYANGAWSPVRELPASHNKPGRLAVNAAGRALVASWNWGMGQIPIVNTFEPASGWGPDVTVPSFERPLALALDDAGRAVMVGGPLGNGIAAVRRPDGTWLAPVVMGGIAEWPKLFEDGVLDVGIDGLGRALVVWHEANVIWARHHRGECSGLTLNCGWGPATALSTGPVAAVGRPRVAVWADGRAVAVWRQGSDVYLRRYQP